MLVILYQTGSDPQAQQIAADLAAAFNNAFEVTMVPAETPVKSASEPSWDDLMVVVFKDDAFPAEGSEAIAQYLQVRRGEGRVLPVALSTASRVPPAPIASLKALQCAADSVGTDGAIVRRIGAMLNLRLQGREAKIFLSHRASDGAQIAAQLFRHLTDLGYRPWLDQAKELDGDTMILPGTPAQEQIDAALADASLVMLLDTPDAPHSKWIRHEINTADGLVLPILPICFRSATDRTIGPRFRSLRELQRWVGLQLPDVGSAVPLTNHQLEQIVHAAEEYLCEILQRKCRVPFLVRHEFESRGFSWTVLDARLHMYRSSKQRGSRLSTEVLNHCSIFDRVYEPALNLFRGYLHQARWAQHPLFVYDGELLPEEELL